MCNNFVGGTIEFLGAPCDDTAGDTCVNNPIVPNFTLAKVSGCRYEVSNVTIDGICVDAETECYWSDGVVGCDRGGATVGFVGCGDHAAKDLTLWVVDKRGCVGEVTHEIPGCCNCDDADGSACSDPNMTLLAFERVDADGEPCISPILCGEHVEGGFDDCAGDTGYYRTRWRIEVDFDEFDNCGNTWAMEATFSQPGSTSTGNVYTTKEFYIEDVLEGYAANACLSIRFFAVTSIDPLLGCAANAFNGVNGGWYWAAGIRNNDFFPGNYNWGCHTPAAPNCRPANAEGSSTPGDVCYYSMNCVPGQGFGYPGAVPSCEIPEEC
ncbi:hypothetical protein [Lacipirellula sp.]|uniref:hypothetical protein n=1 Tax=Lacipirellula sp. TaxID=2691419 RepID=UPI003D1208C5